MFDALPRDFCIYASSQRRHIQLRVVNLLKMDYVPDVENMDIA